jgi:exonuclease-1
MGIKELLSCLDMNVVDCGLLEFTSIAIDMSCYIHKVKYAQDCDLALDTSSKGYIYLLEKYFAHFIKNYSKVYFVFDGKTPKIKSDEHFARRKDFDQKKALARLMLKSENIKERQKAKEMIVQTIETRTLVAGICEYFKNHENVILVSAMYEADYLLTSLSLDKTVDCLMTEDSDMIAHGCENILYKYRYWENECLFYTSDCLLHDKIKVKDFRLFKEFCVMCGCDYFKGFGGIGPKKAMKICSSFKKFKEFIDFSDYNKVFEFNNALAQFNKYYNKLSNYKFYKIYICIMPPEI